VRHGNFNVQRPRLKVEGCVFCCRPRVWWNQLPTELKLCRSTEPFCSSASWKRFIITVYLKTRTLKLCNAPQSTFKGATQITTVICNLLRYLGSGTRKQLLWTLGLMGSDIIHGVTPLQMPLKSFIQWCGLIVWSYYASQPKWEALTEADIVHLSVSCLSMPRTLKRCVLELWSMEH